ncbi:MAG: MFS transporter [Corallococcus sp.]|nr:MFS transporter [Corallococcus sp.]
MNETKTPDTNNRKISLGNKLAFACGDIFGGGSFNIINFLFTPFLTLVVGIPMIYLTPILLLTKLWDGIIDPFIGKITDGKQPGKYGKRRYFMLICAPLVLVGFVLLFFPWNLVTDSVALKCVFVVLVYMLYATAQSFVLIPYYSHASEMTDDFNERNNVNAVRLAFSIASSIICVAVPGLIASPTKKDNGVCYLIMAGVFGAVFAASVLITALFSKEKIVTPSVKSKISLKEFVRPLKVKTYRQYLGMQMCTSMAMAVMSSFFFTFCDFYLRRMTYREVTLLGDDGTRFPIATVAAAMMFVAQIFALPFYLKLIKVKSKRFAYLTGAFIWIGVVALMLILPAETEIGSKLTDSGKTSVFTVSGTPDWAVIIFGLLTGFGIGGTVFVPHSSFGDVCDVGELYFGERTEGAFSGLTNFLNTAAQAIGLAIPPAIIGLAGYVETRYVTEDVYQTLLSSSVAEQENYLGMALSQFRANVGNGSVQLLPISQSESAQLALRLTFTLLPIVIMIIGAIIAFRYKLTKDLQKQIVEANLRQDKTSEEFKQLREELLKQL